MTNEKWTKQLTDNGATDEGGFDTFFAQPPQVFFLVLFFSSFLAQTQMIHSDASLHSNRTSTTPTNGTITYTSITTKLGYIEF